MATLYDSFTGNTEAQEKLIQIVEQLGRHFFAEYWAAKCQAQLVFSRQQNADETSEPVQLALSSHGQAQQALREIQEEAMRLRTELGLEPLNLRVKQFLPGVKWCGAHKLRADSGPPTLIEEPKDPQSDSQFPTFIYRASHPEDAEKPEECPTYRVQLDRLPQTVISKLGLA